MADDPRRFVGDAKNDMAILVGEERDFKFIAMGLLAKLLAEGVSRETVASWIKPGQTVMVEEDLNRQSELANPYHDSRGRFASGPGGRAAKNIRTPDGGFTFNPVSGEEASTGYAISPYPERSKVIDIGKMSDKDVRRAINEYGRDNRDLAKQENHFIGGWHDPQSGGKVYLDVSIVVQDQEKARKLALKHDQIAFFDFSTGQSVQVNANAKSGQA